jgi:hypothetical protein
MAIENLPEQNNLVDAPGAPDGLQPHQHSAAASTEETPACGHMPAFVPSARRGGRLSRNDGNSIVDHRHARRSPGCPIRFVFPVPRTHNSAQHNARTAGDDVNTPRVVIQP